MGSMSSFRSAPPRRPRALPPVLGLVVSLLLGPAPAFAQTEVELAAARQWFKEGEQAERAGDCATAIVKFQKALGVKSTAQLELRVGACQEKLGLFASARDAYERALAMARAGSQKKVVTVAEEQLAAVTPRVPHLTLRASESYEGLRVRIDGEVRSEGVGARIALDPGTHQLVAEAPGRRPQELAVQLEAGADEIVTLALESLVVAAAPPPADAADSGPGALPYVLLGVGGAAVVGGAVLFFVARGQDGDIDARCGGAERLACPASQRDAIESDVASVDRLQGFAFGLGGLGVAAAVVGGVLLASDDGAEAGQRAPAKVAFSPLSGGGALFVSGGF
jgi:hypothetical protein